MRNHLIVTVVGPDQIGIVNRVTKIIVEHEGNVEESRMARLGGEFAMLIYVSVDAENETALKQEILTLQDDRFQVFMHRSEGGLSGQFKGWVPYTIVINGADHEGIVHQITCHLSQKGISIESMDTNTITAPMSGTILFNMEAVIVVPPDLKFQKWRDSLEEICSHLNVNLEVSPYKA